MKKFARLATAALVAASFGLSAGNADAALLLKLGTIKGEATLVGHKDEIEIESFQWGAGRLPGTTTAFTGGLTLSKLCVSSVTMTKQLDLSTTPIIANLVSGMAITKAIIVGIENFGSDVPQEYFRVELDNARITGFSVSSGGDRPSESLSLTFTKARIVYTRPSPTGGAPTTNETTIDLAKIGASPC